MREKGFIPIIIVAVISIFIVSTVATGAILYKKGVIKFNASVLDPVEESMQENVEVIKEPEIKSEEKIRTEENLADQEEQEKQENKKTSQKIISQLKPQLRAEDIFEPEPIKTTEPEIIIKPEPQPIEPVLEFEPEPEVKSEPIAEELNSCVNNCDGLDGWYYSTDFYVCCNENNKICSCKDKEYRDYYCESTSCKFSLVTFGHKDILNCKDTSCVSPIEGSPAPKITNVEVTNDLKVDFHLFENEKCLFVKEPIEIYWRTNTLTYSKILIYGGGGSCCGEVFGQPPIQSKEFDSLSGFSERHMIRIENLCYPSDYYNFEITAETYDYLTSFSARVKIIGILQIDRYGSTNIKWWE